MTACQKIVISLSFFQFMVNSEQSRSRIAGAQFVKLTFSLIVTFYLTKTKTENRTKKSLTQLSQYCFGSKVLFLPKELFAKRNVDISKIKMTLVLKCIFSETTNVCVLTYQI